MNLQILGDIVIGGLITGTFSYISSIFQDDQSIIKITAYLWGAPLFFFYLLYIVWRTGNNTVIAFTRHAALGTAFTICSMIFTLLFYKIGKMFTIISNIVLLFLFLFVYFYYELYTKF